VWSLSAGLAIRTSLVTAPLFLVEIACGTVVTVTDPALLLLGIPLFLLQLVRLTAQFGIARVAQQRLRTQGTPEVSAT
jgi:hypothetical protein